MNGMKNDFDYCIEQLQLNKGIWIEISKACGVTYSWLGKFAQGRIPEPGYHRIVALAKYLRKLEKTRLQAK